MADTSLVLRQGGLPKTHGVKRHCEVRSSLVKAEAVEGTEQIKCLLVKL